jgi:YidC/Oxa1 family membrane protein insertase
MFNTLLVHPLFNLLALIYAAIPGHDFGIAIIILTIIVRLILWPIVTRQLHSQRALQELQPELARIRAEAKGDRALEGRLTMELYKEKEINPFGSLLPLIIQIPVFIALYAVLRDVVKPHEFADVSYPFIKHLGSIQAIINSHTTFDPKLFNVIDLSKASPVMALLAALAQFIQTKQLAPKQNTNDAQAQATAAMTYIFPFLTLLLGLSWPSALTLYWTTSSAVAVLQQSIVLRRDVAELEEAVVVRESRPAPKAKSKRSKA